MKMQLLAFLWITLAFTSGPINGKKTTAPDFTAKTMDGHVVRLSDFRGKVVLLDFWASWCGPCKQEFPFLVQLHETLKKHNFTVLAINVDNQRENMEKFLSKQENQPGFPIIVDHQGKIPGLYNIQGMPTTVLIDKTGRIRYQQTGFKAQDKGRMIKAIKKLL